MAQNKSNQCQMLLLVAEENQSASAQMNSEGHTKLMEVDSPIHSKNKESSGNAITFYNEKGEVENGVMLSDYHIFVNENNEVFTVPPGAIVQGRFKVSHNHLKKSEAVLEESAVETPQENVEVPTTSDASGLPSSTNDSNEMEFTPMEDIELEEEIVSNSELRDLKPTPSKAWDQRQTVLKGSSTGDNKHASQSGRIRRKKRSLPGQFAGIDEKNGSDSTDVQGRLVNSNQIDKLIEIAEVELFADHSQSSSKEFPTQEEIIADISSQTMDCLENNEVTSCSMEEEITNDLNNESLNNPRIPSPLDSSSSSNEHFINCFLMELIDQVANTLPKCPSPPSSNEAISSTQPFIMPSLIDDFPKTALEDAPSSEASIETSRPNCQQCEETSPVESSSKVRDQKDQNESLLPDIQRESSPSSSSDVSPNVVSIEAPHSSMLPRDESHEKDPCEVNIVEGGGSCDSKDGFETGMTQDSVSFAEELSDAKVNDIQVSKREMVDKSVQVLLSNFKVIRVTQDWQISNNNGKNEMLTTRDITRQRRELDEFSAKLKSMEREMEIRASNLKREKSLFEMKKRSFEIEMAKAKSEIEVAKKQTFQKHGDGDKKNELFTQNTYVVRQRKRKSEALLTSSPAIKVPRRSSTGRGSKASKQN